MNGMGRGRTAPERRAEEGLQMKRLLMYLALACAACAAQMPPSPPAAGPQAGSFEVAGSWSGWGVVVLNADGSGTYTDTFKTGPGRMQLRRTGDRSYEGTWGESNQRFGTLTIELSPDGRTITGNWTPDPSVTVGSKEGGAIAWGRQ